MLKFTFSGAENISYLKQQSSQMLDFYSSMKNTPNMYTSSLFFKMFYRGSLLLSVIPADF